MTRTQLGRLERVELREYWVNEASDFTPWLAEDQNVALLGDTIGIELEVQEQEASVGPFRADILCRNTTDNTLVLIENQLEKTDHIHLGQLLTYAAGLDAVTVIWVAQRFTEEHRAALDWLNRITDEGFYFFGLEVELWRIGDSTPAPKFNLVARPNDWSKTVREIGSGKGKLTETQQHQVDYWSSFSEFLDQRNSTFKVNRGPHGWVTFAVGRMHFSLVSSVSMRDGNVTVYLCLTGPDRLAHFDLLEKDKAAIENELGVKPTWKRYPEKKESHVMVWREATPKDPASRPEIYEWLLRNLDAFNRVFRPRIKDLALFRS